jgi:transposase InsO family protein
LFGAVPSSSAKSSWLSRPITWRNSIARGRGEPKPRSNAGTRPSKSRILLENYFLPGDLETQIEAFVEHYNNQRYHESLNNVTPADAYFGRADAIIKQRERIKRKTIEHRRLLHRKIAA